MDLKLTNFSAKYKFVWIAPQRCATQTVSKILSLYDCRYNGRIINNPFIETKQLYTNNIPEINVVEGYDILISCRNPYARTYSIFKNLFTHSFLKDKESFTKFCYDGINWSGLKEVITKPNKIDASFIKLRTEYLLDDLSQVPFIFEKLTTNQLKFMVEIPKPLNDWERFYTSETKKIIYKLTESQFEMFGYEK